VFTAPNASSTLVVLTILLYLPYSKMYILVDQAHIYDLTVSFLYVSIKSEILSDNKKYLTYGGRGLTTDLVTFIIF
jgi:hypothetical protein